MNVEILPMRTNAERALADIFFDAQPGLPGNHSVATERRLAFDRFLANGLPHRRIEAWRYTDLRALMCDAKPLALPPDADAAKRALGAGLGLSGIAGRRLVMIDGVFSPDLSDLDNLEAGLSIRSTAQALSSGESIFSTDLGKTIARDDPALILNTALMGDGVVVQVAEGTNLERALQLVFVATSGKPAAMFMRSVVMLGKGARATLIESHMGPTGSAYQVNAALELAVADDAQFDHLKIIREGNEALHLGTLLVHLGARATLNDFSFMSGGAVVRNQIFAQFAGEGGAANLRGATLLAGRQHADTSLWVDHQAAGCKSRETFKSVLDNEARTAFQGKITVRPGAQRTDARMMARALLLSPDAEANSKPELEIFADDVQCGHGSTTGALDEDLRFYLMARGIPAKQAEALLIQAFIGEVTEAIEDEGSRTALVDATAAWLAARG